MMMMMMLRIVLHVLRHWH